MKLESRREFFVEFWFEDTAEIDTAFSSALGLEAIAHAETFIGGHHNVFGGTDAHSDAWYAGRYIADLLVRVHRKNERPQPLAGWVFVILGVPKEIDRNLR
jgi:hypothetical protein